MTNDKSSTEGAAKEQQPSLEDYKTQRASSKGSITRIKNVVEANPNLSVTELECRLSMIEAYFKQASYHQTQIERFSPLDTGRAEIDELFIATKTRLLTLLQDKKGDNSHEMSMLTTTIQTNHRLPNLRLPRFDGKYLEFKNFLHSFNSLVHNDVTIPIIDKFNHLLSCLSGEALATVKSFQVTEANYKSALERLKERYDNSTLIFLENICAIFEIEKATKSDARQLRNVIDTMTALYSSLKTLGTIEQICDALMIHLTISKVDVDTKRQWDESLDYTTLPTWSQCSQMLEKRCQHLDVHTRRNLKSVPTTSASQQQQVNSKSRKYSFVAKTNSIKMCNFCSKTGHTISVCQQFIVLPIEQRLERAKILKLCANCLSKDHDLCQCTSKYFCRFCKLRHHSLLHKPETTNHADAVQRPTTSTTASVHATSQQLSSQSFSKVILATALILIKDANNEYHMARALLDSCSQVNFISERLATSLQLKRSRVDIEISGIGSSCHKIPYKTQTTICSRVTNFQVSLEFLISRQITGYHPDENISRNELNLPANIELADPDFNLSRNIDILLGAEAFFTLLKDGQIHLGKNLPILQRTSFGWIVSGKCQIQKTPYSSSLHCAYVSVDTLNRNLEKLWHLEDVKSKRKTLSEEQEQCEIQFQANVTLNDEGRIEVKLPFKKNPELLGNSRDIALRRFFALERKLDLDAQLKADYIQLMNEYEQLGHMSETSNPDLCRPHYYIPHHCVLKPTSETTKLRVVFDASCRTASQVSLNDILSVGPTIQNDLLITLLRFRCNKYGLMADISKMYHQIMVSPEHSRNFQLIFWRTCKSSPLRTYKLNTVTYGTASAPFLAIRSLHYAAESYVSPHQIGKSILKNVFYVDDMVTGADDATTLHQIQSEVTEILQHYGMSLTKWHSNCLSMNNASVREIKIDDNLMSALGVLWHPESDTFNFTFSPKKNHSKVTKRTILSLTSSLFDPMGLLTPLTIRAKILLQELWKNNFGWDEEVPESIMHSWKLIIEDFQHISNIQIPRYVLLYNSLRVELHGFADASKRAYGCCFYFRCIDKFNNITSHLLAAKSRVSPLKTRTIPQLELCAAHLMTEFWHQIRSFFDFPITKVYFWSDSELTLHWIGCHSSDLPTFVGNRVAEVQDLADKVVWRHIPTAMNPADLISRGCSVESLMTSMWLHGPEFLQDVNIKWPAVFTGYSREKESISIVNQTTLQCQQISRPYVLEKINNISHYLKAVRTVAYMLRFKRKKGTDWQESISVNEFELALLRIISVIQRHNFFEDFKKIQDGKLPSSRITSLNPVLDNTHSVPLLRVGGRLSKSNVPEEVKFSILLPKDEPFVRNMVVYLHTSNYHAGPRALVAIIQQRFWIINCKALATSVVKQCVHCARYKPKLLTQIMSDLPADRVTESKPFSISGVDFAGPIPTYYNIRGRAPTKSYIAVFICFSIKAVHLEVVSDLTSDAFIAALKRFIGRRGYPQKIYCDNATNFVGADSKLRDLHKSFQSSAHQANVNSFCTPHRIEFIFIPPRAPHFGGLWEAAVKTCKGHLFRTLPNAKLTFEELQTALVEIEAVMNSRPISPISTDANDFEALTPAHFLTGSRLEGIPEKVNLNAEISYMQRWQRVSAVKAHFWQRWRMEYLTGLQNRYRWQSPHVNLKVGDMVVLFEENVPPMKWTIGRVINVFTGSDGKVRVVEIKTPNTVLKRPITKLALLPSH